MKQFLVFVSKEFYHVFRDRKTLLMLFGLPVMQILLFGFALTNEVKNSKIVIVDYAKDIGSQKLITQIEASNYFEIEKALMSYKDIEAAFKQGTIKAAVVFPANFNNDLLHTNRAQIQIIADASDPNLATQLTNYLNNIISGYPQLTQNAPLPYQIVPEVRMLYNPELKGATTFVPGVMALVLMLVCTMMTSVSIVREKELGTMEILLVSPFKPLLVILSKAVPYLVLSLFNLSVILVLSVFLLDMPINGSIFLLFFESTLFIVTSLSVGLIISTATSSQQMAMSLSMMGMLLPTLLFTGFLFPLENMPVPLQVIANVVPSKWYYIIIKDVMLKGLGISSIWKETFILAGMTVTLLAISLKKFKVRLA